MVGTQCCTAADCVPMMAHSTRVRDAITWLGQKLTARTERKSRVRMSSAGRKVGKPPVDAAWEFRPIQVSCPCFEKRCLLFKFVWIHLTNLPDGAGFHLLFSQRRRNGVSVSQYPWLGIRAHLQGEFQYGQTRYHCNVPQT